MPQANFTRSYLPEFGVFCMEVDPFHLEDAKNGIASQG